MHTVLSKFSLHLLLGLALIAACDSKPKDDGVLDLEGLLVVRVVDTQKGTPIEGASVEITAVGKATGPNPVNTNDDGLMVVEPPKAERMISVHADGHAPNRKHAPLAAGFAEVPLAQAEVFELVPESSKQMRPFRPFRPIETGGGTEVRITRAPDLREPVAIVADPDPRDSRGLGTLPSDRETGTPRDPSRFEPEHAVFVDIRDSRPVAPPPEPERRDGGDFETPVTRTPRPGGGEFEVQVTSPPRLDRPLVPDDPEPTRPTRDVFHYDDANDTWVVTEVEVTEVDAGNGMTQVQYTIDEPGWWATGWEIREFTCVRGCVVDSAGDPVAGTQLTLLGTGANVDSATAYTDVRGCFAADVKPGESYAVLASSIDGEQIARIDDTGPPGTRVSQGRSRCFGLDDIQLEPRDVQEALCASGADECGNQCVDLTRDPDHCGQCGEACDDGTRCIGGACVEPNPDTVMASCQAGRAGPLCEPCPAGTYCAGGDADPESCAAGTWDHDGSAATPCRPHARCEPGEFVALNGSRTRNVQCEACESGSFSTAEDADVCDAWRSCPAGQTVISEGTATQDRLCGGCDAGTYCPGGASGPVPCGAGTWDHDSTPSTECVALTTCTAGQRVVSLGNATTNTTCTQCAAGTFSASVNATQCTSWTDCVPGQFVALEGSTSADRLCASCPGGTQSQTNNAPQCTLAATCLPGTEQTAPATATSDAVCDACGAGEYCPGGAQPAAACGSGDWDHDSDPATACRSWTSCAAGSYRDQAGSATQDATCASWTDCLPGQYVAQEGTGSSDRVCASCPGGTNSLTNNAPQCTAAGECQPGSVEVEPSTQSSDAVCEACDAGEYCPGGSDPAVPCGSGNWDHDGDPVTACQPWRSCTSGTYVSQAGSATQDATCADWTDCVPGQYVAQAGSSSADRVCASCPGGTLSLTNNASQCTQAAQCPPGTLQTAPATSSSNPVCSSCSAGQFCPGGSDPAVTCGDGDWDHDGNPATACQPHLACSPGEYVDEAGSSTEDASCATCPNGTTSIVTNATRCGTMFFDAVDVNKRQVCGIRSDNGRVMCWGYNHYGFPFFPEDEAFVEIHMENFYACGLTASGKLNCWGNMSTNGGNYSRVKFNGSVICRISADTGFLYCSNLDPGNFGYTPMPTNVAVIDVDFTWDTDFGDYGCYLRADNQQVGCWGYYPEDLEDPVAGEQFDELGIGNTGGSDPFFGCGIRATDQTLTCWGPGNESQSFVQSLAGVPVRDLEVGGSEVCLFRDDTGEYLCQNTDTSIVAGRSFQSLGFGSNGVGCGLEDDGLISCWGDQPNTWTTLAPSSTRYDAVFPGEYVMCARRESDGELECWESTSDSYNEFGELDPPSGVDFTAVDTAARTACGIRSSDNLVQCWGESMAGTPTFAVSAISGGSGHFCVLRASNGTPYCWGDDSYSQVADTPTSTELVSIDSAQYVNCGLTSNDRAVCWGGHTVPALSDAPNTAFKAVATDGSKACGLRVSDDTPECWGVNWGEDPPQIAMDSIYMTPMDTTTLCYFEPGSQVPECWSSGYTRAQWAHPTEAVDMMVGSGYSCAIRSADKTLTCFGYATRNPKHVPTNPYL